MAEVTIWLVPTQVDHEWCNTCNLSTLAVITVYKLSDNGVSTEPIRLSRCTECEQDTEG